MTQQPVLIGKRALGMLMTVAMGKCVHPSCLDEIGQDEGRPCESKKVDAEGIGQNDGEKWSNYECVKDEGSDVDEELSGI